MPYNQGKKGRWLSHDKPKKVKKPDPPKKVPAILMPVVRAIHDTQQRAKYAREAQDLRLYTDRLAERWGIDQHASLALFTEYVAQRPATWQQCKLGFEMENMWRETSHATVSSGPKHPTDSD